MAVVFEETTDVAPRESEAVADGSPAAVPARLDGDEQILQLLGELRVEVSALRSEVLGQNQQMLSRIQFLHEGLIGRIKQMREQPPQVRRRPGR